MAVSKCPSCGKAIPYGEHCFNCGFDVPRDPSAPPPSEPRSRFPHYEQVLSGETNGWTMPGVVRQYSNNPDGQARFAREAEVFGLHGYSPTTQSTDGGHVHVGRLLMTSGLSILAGKKGIRSDGTITVTFQKAPEPQPAPVDRTDSDNQSGRSPGLDALAMLEKLGQLRDVGVLSADEFETKKADLLRRL